jgi:ABC-type multidrug transport system fused ATPase/permease subunit
MPREWNLLSPKEYNNLNGITTSTTGSQDDKPNVDKDSQIMLLFAMVGVFLLLFGGSFIQLVPLVVLVIGVTQINHQNSLDPIDVFRFLTLNPLSTLHLLGYWILGMFSVAVMIISSIVTFILWLLNQVVASSAGTNSGVRNVLYDATAVLQNAKHDFARHVSASRLGFWLAAALLAYSNYRLMQEPSTACILICMALGIFLIICIMSSSVERPRSAANDSNPVIPPPTTPPATPAAQVLPTPRVATTLFGRSGVAFADPLSTPQSVSIKSLPDGLRPKPLIYDFGTPTRGPLSKDFGARRSLEGLYQVQPTFFTSPPRQIFT